MSKSKCADCGKLLKAGDWRLVNKDGAVKKVCIDKRNCMARERLKNAE
jgi:hypothetical protein